MVVDANPKMLVWAREESGIKLEVVAAKLNIGADLLERIERDGLQIEYNLLDALAAIYKRQTAVFFLPTTPNKCNKPKDFRSPDKPPQNYSPETMLAIRRAERYLQTARELYGPTYWKGEYRWLGEVIKNNKDADYTASNIRELLHVTIEDQENIRNAEDAFRFWRNAIEDRFGIFIFQYSPNKQEKIDGFSYLFGEYPYAIVINNRKHPIRKIFTMFHELSHIIRREPAACLTDRHYETEQHQNTELYCDALAGKVLLPAQYLEVITDVEDIFKRAYRLKISGEAYLRRLLEEKMINSQVFYPLLKDVRAYSEKLLQKKKPKKDNKKGPSMIIQSKSTRGKRFYDMVTSAAINNQLSLTTAGDLLGLKASSIKYER